MRQFFRYLSLTLVVFLTANAIITYTVLTQLLNPDLYKEALSQSDIYSVTTTILENKVSDALIDLQKGIISEVASINKDNERFPFVKSLVITSLNSLVENQTRPFISNLSEKFQLEKSMQGFVEERIDRDIAWLKGEAEDPKLFQYIPEPAEIEKLKKSSLVDFSTDITASALGVQTLPVCASKEEEANNLLQAAQGNLLNVICTSPEIQPFITSGISTLLPQDNLEQATTEIQNTLDVFGVRTLLDDLLAMSALLADMKQQAIQLKTDIQTARQSAYALFLMTLPLMVLGMVLTPHKRRIKTFIVTYLITAGWILSLSLLYYTAIPSVVKMIVPLDTIQFGTGLLTETEGALLVASISSAVLYMFQHAITLTLYIGLMGTCIMGIVYLTYLFFRSKPDKKEVKDKKVLK